MCALVFSNSAGDCKWWVIAASWDTLVIRDTWSGPIGNTLRRPFRTPPPSQTQLSSFPSNTKNKQNHTSSKNPDQVRINFNFCLFHVTKYHQSLKFGSLSDFWPNKNIKLFVKNLNYQSYLIVSWLICFQKLDLILKVLKYIN